jgi:hypothetical protein
MYNLPYADDDILMSTSSLNELYAVPVAPALVSNATIHRTHGITTGLEHHWSDSARLQLSEQPKRFTHNHSKIYGPVSWDLLKSGLRRTRREKNKHNLANTWTHHKLRVVMLSHDLTVRPFPDPWF